ncbi:MAG: hypothetical protein P4L55_13005 [Syntrophobacteraceae bacterium]|nr:hypothetical protein [Syntrophobacteraceae bacterium]
MVWLETINIRSAGATEARKVLDLCRRIVESTASEKGLRLKIFCNAAYATDISIHLQWKSDPGAFSILGKELSSALQDHGLISHSVWIEQEGPAGIDPVRKTPGQQGSDMEGNESHPGKRPDSGSGERENPHYAIPARRRQSAGKSKNLTEKTRSLHAVE